MAQVDQGYADWLKSEQRTVEALNPAAATWGDIAVDSAVLSPLAQQADAQAEADRQRTFLAGPLARDTIVVKGLRADLIGRLVTITGDRLGYEGAGAAVFVVGVAESERTDITTLNVIKRL